MRFELSQLSCEQLKDLMCEFDCSIEELEDKVLGWKQGKSRYTKPKNENNLTDAKQSRFN